MSHKIDYVCPSNGYYFNIYIYEVVDMSVLFEPTALAVAGTKKSVYYKWLSEILLLPIAEEMKWMSIVEACGDKLCGEYEQTGGDIHLPPPIYYKPILVI